MNHNVRTVSSNMRAQGRFKSVCASSQSDQSLHRPYEDNFFVIQIMPSKYSYQAACMRILI